MQITITLRVKDKSYDLMLDNKQTISQGVAVLQDAGRMQPVRADFYHSCCAQRVVSAYRTLEEQQIYSGDLLEAIL